MNDIGELTQKLKMLSDTYAAQLPAKFAQLEQLWQKLPVDRWDEDGFQELHRTVHSMTGSGKTFGFSALSDVARNLEIYLKQIAESKAIPGKEQSNHIMSLLSELQQVALKRDVQPLAQGGLPTAARRSTGSAADWKIFIAEDDIECAESLRSQLCYFGYDVNVFNRLEDFRHAMQTREAGDIVVVMDISFPEDSWGGIHVMQEIQQGREVPLPVVFLSSHDELEARLGAARAGSVAYFNKGFDTGSLIEKLDQLTSSQVDAPYRVLAVDDSPSLTAYYAAVLEQAGMLVKSVNNPLQVMQPLLEFEPDLLLIDMYMPGCDGMELAKVIRQIEAFVSIPIVFLSAEKDLDKQLSAMMLGGDDFLTKPIQPQHLVASVSNRIRRSLKLQSFMMRDSLTGLLNHTTIKDQLEREMARSKRQKTQSAYAMIDIDHFKKVNDTYGHPAGDRVIKNLARLLKQRLRENDSVGRYGGEEFAVILADADAAATLKVLDRIREDFSRLLHHADGKEFSVTFSCGVADVSSFSEASRLCDAADKALYKAKHAGRNQVVLAHAEYSDAMGNSPA